MKQISTNELLVQYLYGELDIADRLELEDSLSFDWNLKEDHEELKAAFDVLPRLRMQPKRW